MLNKFQQTNVSGPQNKKMNKAQPAVVKKAQNPENPIKSTQNNNNNSQLQKTANFGGNSIQNNNNSSQLQKTANFGGNNSFSNNMTTPKKSLPSSGIKPTLPQESNLVSDQKEGRSLAEHRGIQRGHLLYTRAVEKQKIR